MGRYFFLFLIPIVLSESCYLEKRKYLKGYYIQSRHLSLNNSSTKNSEVQNTEVEQNNKIILEDSIVNHSAHLVITGLNSEIDFALIESGNNIGDAHTEFRNNPVMNEENLDKNILSPPEFTDKINSKKERDFEKIAFIISMIVLSLFGLAAISFGLWIIPTIPEFVYFVTSISIVVALVLGVIAFIYGIKAYVIKGEIKTSSRIKLSLIVGSAAVFTVIAFIILAALFS